MLDLQLLTFLPILLLLYLLIGLRLLSLLLLDVIPVLGGTRQNPLLDHVPRDPLHPEDVQLNGVPPLERVRDPRQSPTPL